MKFKLVGVHRLELWTSRMSSERSNQLSYTPESPKGRTYVPAARLSVNAGLAPDLKGVIPAIQRALVSVFLSTWWNTFGMPLTWSSVSSSYAMVLSSMTVIVPEKRVVRNSSSRNLFEQMP